MDNHVFLPTWVGTQIIFQFSTTLSRKEKIRWITNHPFDIKGWDYMLETMQI